MINKLKNAVLSYPDRTAYIHNDKSFTYRELWDRAIKYADLLKRQGNGVVIIYGHKSPDMLVSILACIIARRAYVPVDTYMPISRITSIRELTGADLVIANEEISLEDTECLSLTELGKYSGKPEYCCTSDIIYMIFTSGSTGNAKGVPISNENLINFTDWLSGFAPFDGYDGIRVMNQASFSFDLSVADIYYALCNGHTLVAMDRDIQQDFGRMYEFFAKNRIELTVTTPTFIKMCLLIKEFDQKHLPYIKAMYFCGEQLERDTVIKLKRRFPTVAIVNAYGPTEATSAVSASLITKKDLEGEGLLPTGDMDRLATDIRLENDEIVLSGKSVFGGYLGGVTGGYFKDNQINCYRTGDTGYIKDGKLYCKGRLDSQIKYMGYRIELYDIENNVKAIKGVIDAAVVAKKAPSGAVRQIRAYVVACEGITPEDIKKELEGRTPHYMIPARIVMTDALPLNENKKIDRRRLSEL